mgnify:CR=1 FL=1
MENQGPLRVPDSFYSILRSEELFPHNGSTHHSRFWCHVPPAVIDFWVFTEGHLHTDFLTDDAGVGIFSGGFYGCERSSYNIGTSGAGNDRSNAVTNCNVEGGVIPFQSVNSAESGKSWTGIFISVHFRGTGGSPESDMAVGVHEPGVTTLPAASITSQSAGTGPTFPTRDIFPFSIKKSCTANIGLAKNADFD